MRKIGREGGDCGGEDADRIVVKIDSHLHGDYPGSAMLMSGPQRWFGELGNGSVKCGWGLLFRSVTENPGLER